MKVKENPKYSYNNKRPTTGWSFFFLLFGQATYAADQKWGSAPDPPPFHQEIVNPHDYLEAYVADVRSGTSVSISIHTPHTGTAVHYSTAVVLSVLT